MQRGFLRCGPLLQRRDRLLGVLCQRVLRLALDEFLEAGGGLGLVAERKALEGAQALGDSGKFAEAAKAYDSFLTQYPRSPLAANAVFGSALAYAALGDKAKATAGFQEFLKREPQHPLAKDAEQAIAALK